MIEGVEFCFCFGGMTNSAKLVGLMKNKSENSIAGLGSRARQYSCSGSLQHTGWLVGTVTCQAAQGRQ